ncbi:MAG: FAD-dependent oxidoreductase, partial [Gemmatimonadota bacterium]
IATGGRPTIPPIPGLVATDPLTSETVFELDAMPARLAVIGGGPIGCELAQAFARFGAAVTLVEHGERLLANDDPDAAAVVAASLLRDGVGLQLGTEVVGVEASAGAGRLTFRQQGEHRTIDADAILVAVGRMPSVADLGLEAAGVAFDERGVTVDDRLRTTNGRIYAAGDVSGGLQFTHVADAQARVVLRNALFAGRQRASSLTIPWCTYTDPEVAHVGHTAATASAAGLEVETFTHHLGDVDRAVLDGETDGFARVHLRKGSEQIVGATVVAAHGGEMISQMVLAMTAGVGLGAVARTIHPYPTQAEVWKRLADAHQRARLTPRVAGFLRQWLALRR